MGWPSSWRVDPAASWAWPPCPCSARSWQLRSSSVRYRSSDFWAATSALTSGSRWTTRAWTLSTCSAWTSTCRSSCTRRPAASTALPATSVCGASSWTSSSASTWRRRHPKLDICFPSGGGALASLIGRMTAAAVAPRPWVLAELHGKSALREQFRRLWFDTHMHDDGALRLLREHCGDRHLVFGTNFAGWDQEQGENPPDVAGIDLVGNARRLLRLQSHSQSRL
mmetsp:Transcript_59457/g.192257  ORF Transcript_59457/g.192257 Transcript_59457/m.192257 type:complete len:225 (+) Transcript_59457:1508-2182(+)